MRLHVVAALLLCLALPTAARAETPIRISADTFEVNEESHEATFSGNVLIDRDGLELKSAKVVIEYGEAGVDDIRSFTAVGGVRVKTQDQTATAERAVFVPATQMLTLSGNVKVESAVGTLTGPQLVINLKTMTSVFSGGGGGRVTGVFTPQ